MIIIIDGYNLLKQIFPHVKGRLDQQRDMFVRHLGYYKHKKAADIKDIIVVFDAGPFSHASREVHHGVVVIFSGQKSSADDWIIEYVEKHRNEELLVVTNDNKIIAAALRYNATNLSSNDFYHILQGVLFEKQDKDKSLQAAATTNIKKFGQSDYFNEELEGLDGGVDKQMLDLLMEQASLNAGKVESPDEISPKSKQKSHELSKLEKKFYSKLKKLY
jgi:predicted RNA-binding protein with PIN domain